MARNCVLRSEATLMDAKKRAIAPVDDLHSCIMSEIDAGKEMARAFGAAARADDPSIARAFGSRLVRSWWSELSESAGAKTPIRPELQQFPKQELPHSADVLAQSLGKTVAQLDAETAAFYIGVIYTGMLPRPHRAEHGIYYTPPAITQRLIDQASAAGIDWATARVLDPACGGGAFLAPVARRILDTLTGCEARILVENVATRLRGYEIDPFAAWLSQVALDAVMLPITEVAGKRLPVVVAVCDSLTKAAPKERFDLVIGNPPYGRVKLGPELRDKFKRSLFGHANLYGVFTDIALRHAKSDGVIAYVTPTSFLSGEYFKALRGLIGREAKPKSFDFVTARKGVFDDVLQETILAVYRKGHSEHIEVSEITPTRDAKVEVLPAGKGYLPVSLTSPWILPRNAQEAGIVSAMAAMPTRLSDWGYRVSTGPLVWNRFKSQLSARAAKGRLPLLWAEAVGRDGSFTWRADRRGHTKYFETSDRDSWLITTHSCVLLQRTTAKEQSRRLIAAALPQEFLDLHGGAIIENHLNMVRPVVDEPAVSSSVLAAFLNSNAADRAFRCISGSVAVSASELEALPIPDAGALKTLVELVDEHAPKALIEAECMRLYEES